MVQARPDSKSPTLGDQPNSFFDPRGVDRVIAKIDDREHGL